MRKQALSGKQALRIAGIVWGLVMVPSYAWADDTDPDPFGGLVAGARLPDAELEAFTGRGAEIAFGGGVNNGSVSGTFQSTVASGAFSDARGILQITQFNGDGNTVNISVDLTVNINTTTITNSSGVIATPNNSVNFSGGNLGFSGP